MGEKLSFHKLVSEKNYTVEIPIIQRDYAQGRESANEIRYQFLVALKEYLSGDKPIELDFIYGSLVTTGNKTLFIPLDGQQRLTTLFLLHWYLAVKENRMSEFRNIILSNGKAKFSYETRISSRDFCFALISNDIDLTEIIHDSISDVIKDSCWFFLSWQNDPTIQSMLVVIDDIHNIFTETEGFFDKLINNENPIICFQFIELKNFGLTDSLYVKMNSRGKELTEFENFKARFEQYIENSDKEKGTYTKAEFAKKIDTDWTDLFWNYRDNSTNVFDSQLMNFIRVLATNNYALIESNRNEFEKNIRILTDKSTKVSFVRYESLKCLDSNCLQDIIQTLDYLKNGINKIKTFLEGKKLINESSLFDKVVQNNLTYTERIIFFGLYKYLITNNGNSTGLYDWMRVVRNLTVNTIYNDAEAFSKSIKSLNILLPHSADILNFLSNPSFKIEGFAEIQILEERIKAILILKNNNWRSSIIKFEEHGYFKGQIDFLLKFSGIKVYFKSNNNLNWNENENQTFFELFNLYGKKASSMFSDHGLKKYDSYLWQRALLSKGDYLLWTSRNYSFLIDDDRDISWKRLLRDDTDKRDYLKLLFDEITVDTANIDLQRIIENDNCQDWRKYFIKRPEILDVCGDKKFIRYEDSNDILLLERSQTNGLHREYYSYALKVRLEKSGNKVYYFSTNSVDYLKFIEWINNKSVEIAYVYSNGGYKYRFKVSEKNYLFFTTEQEIVDYLKLNNYTVDTAGELLA
jgi:hypothetical protein